MEIGAERADVYGEGLCDDCSGELADVSFERPWRLLGRDRWAGTQTLCADCAESYDMVHTPIVREAVSFDAALAEFRRAAGYAEAIGHNGASDGQCRKLASLAVEHGFVATDIEARPLTTGAASAMIDRLQSERI